MGRQWVARAAMHAVPALPAQGRRWRRGSVPPRDVPILADDGGSAADPCGPGPGRPTTNAAPPDGPYHTVYRPLDERRAGVARYLWGRGAQTGPWTHGDVRVPTTLPAPRHRLDGPRHPRPLRLAARRPRTDPLVVCPVRDVVECTTGGRDMPGRLRPHSGAPATGPAKLAEAPAAGDRQEVPGVPGPTNGWPDRYGYLDPADRRPVCRSEVEPSVLHLAAYPPQASRGTGPPFTMPP